jgi:TonB family protein
MDDLSNDIERYKKGELSPSEMHKLERKALSDPFLADALKGIDSLSSTDVTFDLNELKSRLADRTSKKDVSIWTWPARIAAAFAFIAISSYLIFNLASDSRQTIALNETSLPPLGDTLSRTQGKQPSAYGYGNNDSAQIVSADPEPAKEIETDTKKIQPTPPTQGATPRDQELLAQQTVPAEVPVSETVDAQPSTLINENEAAAEVVSSTGVDKSRTVDEGFVRAESQIPARAKRANELAPSVRDSDASTAGQPTKRVIRGRVVDAEDGQGLPGVNIILGGTEMGTFTDANGNYEVTLDSVEQQLAFSFIGYKNKEIAPGPDNVVNVAMETDYSQLSEVVVVGYGTAKDTTDWYPNIEMAYPQGGRRAYKQYLVSQMRYPEEALNNEVEGRVTIQFTVETSGALSDFKVLKGIGYGCEEEVIRLIKSGPKWTATRRNTRPVQDRVRVRVKFSLPKK